MDQNAVDAAIAAAIANANANQQQLIDQAVAAAAANVEANPPAQAATFSRTPAHAVTGIIDLSTSTGMKTYNLATTGLTPKFNFSSAELYMFLKNGEAHANASAWRDIYMIPEILGPNAAANAVPRTRNLFSEYGIITVDEIRTHAMTYELANGRNAQNSSQFHTWIMNSLTDDAKGKILIDADDYTIPLEGDMKTPNGPLCLKVLIRNCTIDTRSTNFHLRTSLTSQHLQTYLTSVSYDIELLNQHVKTCHAELMARGESSSDVLVNLFATYLTVPDKPFHDYVVAQKDKYDEGADIDDKKLMLLALTKYKDRIRANEWQAPSAEQEQIIALTAQINDLKKKKGFERNDGAKKKKTADSDDPRFAWKKVAPAEGDPKSKVVNGKTYHFGCRHKAWVLHKPEDCRMKGPNMKDESKESKKSATGPSLEMSKAMKAIWNGDDDESDSDQE